MGNQMKTLVYNATGEQTMKQSEPRLKTYNEIALEEISREFEKLITNKTMPGRREEYYFEGNK